MFDYFPMDTRRHNIMFFLHGSQCMQKSCFIQRQFAEEVVDLIGADPVQFFNDNQSYYNVFGDDNVCVKHRTNGRQAECCGDYPAKFPFNPLNHECCEDGSSQLIGQC